METNSDQTSEQAPMNGRLPKVYELLSGQTDTRYKHSSVHFNQDFFALLRANGDYARLTYTAKLLQNHTASPQASICCSPPPTESKRNMSFCLPLKAHRPGSNVEYVPSSSPVSMVCDVSSSDTRVGPRIYPSPTLHSKIKGKVPSKPRIIPKSNVQDSFYFSVVSCP